MPTPSASPFLGPRIAAIGFAVMAGAFGLNFAAGQFVAPLEREEGWGLGALSLAAGVNTAVAGIVQPLAGRAIDRIGARPVIATAIGLLAGSYLLLAAVEELWQLFLVYGLLAGAAFGASSSMAVGALISHWYTRRRATVLARVFMGINAGQLTLLPLGGLLIDHAGPRTAYLVLGLLVALLVVPAAALGLRSRPADVGQRPDGVAAEASVGVAPAATLGQARRDADWWRLTATFGINGATLYLTLLHLPRLADDLGGGPAAGGMLLAVAAAASAASMLAQGALAARVDARRLIAALLILRAGSLAVAATAGSVGALLAASILFGAASFPVIPLVTAAIGDRFGTRAIGAVLGTTFVVHQVSAGLAVLAGGLVRAATGSYAPALAAAAGLALAGAAVMTRVAAPGRASTFPQSINPAPEGGTP